MKLIKFVLISSLSLSLLNLATATPTAREIREPEGATGFENKKLVFSKKYMVTAANPHAVKAGADVLKRGGNAIDAAIAVQLVLNVVEPQSSGIGGGAFMVYFDKKSDHLTTFDGRETAPASVDKKLFIKKDGKPMNWFKALVGGKSVGVPGVLKMLESAHKKHGKLPWKDLFKPAIKHAKNGFKVSKRLHLLIAKGFNPGLKISPNSKAYFYKNGQPLKVGTLLKSPELAKTFTKISEQGAKAFYSGAIAKAIIKKVNSHPTNRGYLSLNDLANYKSIERKPVCGTYRLYKVCGMGPPTSGGIAVIQILSILENFDLKAYSPNALKTVHLYTQANKLAFADRSKYVADPAFFKVPIKALLNKNYLKKRSRLINPKLDMGKAKAGKFDSYLSFKSGFESKFPSTSHISIVDSYGNAVSMTTSIEMAFGSTLMVKGFLLNNQLTDFSFKYQNEHSKIANRVQANKRPRSSMAPMMVFDKKGKLKMIVGSPGGSQIINYTAKAIIATIDWNLDLTKSMALPHYSNRDGATYLEANTEVAKLKTPLEAMGHKIKITDMNSGLHSILVTPNGYIGAADPRREGIALGE